MRRRFVEQIRTGVRAEEFLDDYQRELCARLLQWENDVDDALEAKALAAAG